MAQCICDGVDIIKLKGSHDFEPADASSGWKYRLGVCGPIDLTGLPLDCKAVPAGTTAVMYKDGECKELGGYAARGADVIAVRSETVTGKIDGVTLIYTAQTQDEAQLKIQCTNAVSPVGKMLDITSKLAVPGAGKQFFSKWATKCNDPIEHLDTSALGIILGSVAAVVGAVVIVGVVFIVRKRRRDDDDDSDDELEQPIMGGGSDSQPTRTNW